MTDPPRRIGTEDMTMASSSESRPQGRRRLLVAARAARDDDAAGVYVSWVDLSDEAGYAENETALELFYKWQCTGSVSLEPTVTWVLNPSGDPTTDDAVVGMLRASVEF